MRQLAGVKRSGRDVGSTHGPATWDERVATWERIAASPSFQRLAARIVEAAAPTPEDRVVDLGAGTGLLALELAPRVDRVVAIDQSEAMLRRLEEKARADGIANVRPLVGDLRSLPLEDESATLVVSNYAFHHLRDPDKEIALAEARRVLAPGGRLVVCDMMFQLSLAPRDRALIARKLKAIARRGPAGLVRIARNAARLAAGRWEYPASLERWRAMLERRRFAAVSVRALEEEAGLAVAERPGRAEER